jgi:hypothetical protein
VSLWVTSQKVRVIRRSGRTGTSAGVGIADEAGQHADARPGGEQLVLGVDAGGAQRGRKAGVNLVQIAQLRRIEQVGDIADQAVALRQVARCAGRAVVIQIGRLA